jgi:hypothetical protein
MVEFQHQMLAGVTRAKPVVQKECSTGKNRKSTPRIDRTEQVKLRFDEGAIGIRCPGMSTSTGAMPADIIGQSVTESSCRLSG